VTHAETESWIRSRVGSVHAIEVAHERPWATVLRVQADEGTVWFKACAAVQAFEPQLTARLFARWPDRVVEVLDHDEARGWLLLRDAGEPVGSLGNPPEAWLVALPVYAELQRDEAARAGDHLEAGVPDLRVGALPDRIEELLRRDLPLARHEHERLRQLAPRFGEFCRELAACGIADTIQHDDLHHRNLYVRDGSYRVLDWGDSSISHPFASLVVTFGFLETVNGLTPGDRWFARLSDAYLEPWGGGHEATLALVLRVGSLAHCFAWTRQRDHLPADARTQFDVPFATVLRHALDRLQG
jgi:hypothetical protein